MAIRMLWKYVIGRTKTVFKNYNVIERAEKIMETEKRVAPRHPGTEAKFKVLVKGAPELKDEIEKRPTELLDRLKIVKVTSAESPEERSQRSLPQSRERMGIPIYGYEEPKVMPLGKCSLKQALEFITNHHNDSNAHTIESIATAYKMKPLDVENVIKHFNVFHLYDSKKGGKLAYSTMESLGVGKVVKPRATIEILDVPATPGSKETN